MAAPGGAGGTGQAGGAAGAGGGPGGGAAGGAGGAVDPFAACVWDLGSGTTMAGPPPTTNDSADLSGAVLGDIAFAPSTMRKAIPVHVATSLSGFVVGPMAYVTRNDPTTEALSLTLPVQNHSADVRCFVRAAAFTWRDATGKALNDPTTFAYVQGSVGLTAGGTYTDTCLGPQESGYFLDAGTPAGGDALYTALTSIDLSLDSTTTGVVAGSVRPYRYDVGHCPMPEPRRSLRVWARNDGQSYVRVATDGLALDPAVLLDEQGVPAGWTYLSRDVATVVDVGQTTQMVGNLGGSFSLSRAALFFSFDGPPVPGVLAAWRPMPALPLVTAEDSALAQVRQARAAGRARWQAMMAGAPHGAR